jgi:4'-phosphopantetheinyl transferase
VALGGGDERALARRALRELLGARLGMDPADVALETGPHGKPRLAGGGALSFNLTHTAGLALVALADGREVGVDAERVRADRDVVALARHGLGEAAARELAGLPPAEAVAAFHRRWVRHEAVLKCHAVGLVAPVPVGAAAVVCDLDVGPGVAAAVAVAGDRPATVRVRAS